MTDLLLQPAGVLLDKLRTREISSAELVAAALARIGALNPKLNAFCALDGEAARTAARASDARLAGGDFRPLEGLPIDVKDAFDAVGFTASAGASAAILGLLVVAVSVVNADDANPTTRELRTVLAGSAFCCPGRHLHRLDRGLNRGLSRLRAIKPRNGNRRPGGHHTADTEGKAGWKFLPPLSKQKAEYRLRGDFRCGLKTKRS